MKRPLYLLLILFTIVTAPVLARTSTHSSVVDLAFEGHYRAEVKTSFAEAPTEECAPLEAVMKSLLADQRMRAKYPEISSRVKAPTVRMDQEERNVCVIGYIFAVKLENGQDGDNDFHVILGTNPKADAKFLNVEVSGVPSKGDPSAFREARQELIAVIGRRKLHSSFTRFRKPIKVKVIGSLYFDADHTAGQVGPVYAKPKTVWEIHPVKSIEKSS